MAVTNWRARVGAWVGGFAVPGVTEVCRRQSTDSQAGRAWFNAQRLLHMQTGQTNPSGHRRSTRIPRAGRVFRKEHLELLARHRTI